MRLLLFSAFIFIHLLNWAQNAPNNSTLSLGEIMKGNEFIGHHLRISDGVLMEQKSILIGIQKMNLEILRMN